ncbi:MAG: cell surface protein SprA, partial [Gemmatimonadota bacterium]
NLRVSGNESITISGNSSWVVGRVTGERGGGSLFPKLDMRQRLNVNLQGTIGTKLFIDVAQNSDALTPLENAIKIRYKGEEDDVLQAVELGNTNLSLPPTQFISYSTRQEGLFGAKAVAQIGNIDITAIASRKEGESGKATFTGGSQERTVRIDDTNFVNGKFFFLTDPDSLPVPNQILEVRLYLDDNSPFNDQELGAQPADVWLDPALRTPADSVRGTFHLLDEGEDGDYVLYNSQDYQSSSIPQIVLRNRLLPTHTLAVAYSVLQNDGTIDTVGTFQAAGDTTLLQLKMMRPSTKQWATPDNDLRHSPWASVRRLEMKNVYDLQVRNIEATSFELTIVRDIAGENGNNPLTLDNQFGASTQLLEVLGLDQKNNLDPSSRIPDGLVDPEYVELEHGYLFFPDLRPFDPSLTDIEGSPVPGGRARSWPRDAAYSRPDTLGWEVDPATGLAVPSPEAWRSQETVPEIYDLLPTYLSSVSQEHHLYTIEVKTQSASKSTIQLDTFGSEVLSGSETVRLNGQVLERGKDYNIFYETGLLQINHPDATSPGADLVVTYDYDSPFSTGSQSLLGTSISTRDDPASKFLFSTSWLHEVNGNPDRRPRLGGEPTRTTVGDVSGRVRLQPWLLTDIVDRLPLVRTNAASRLELQGAVGVSMPNPNTRGEVYIDDMEGSEVVVPASIARGAWFYSSVPDQAVNYLDGGSEVFFKPKPADRGQLLWFSPTTVQVKDLTPREDNQQTRDDLVPVLEVVYVPQTDAGVYDSWGGLVTPLRVGGTIDVSTSQFLEVWVNDFVNDRDNVNRRGELLIDVGTVNEDAVWDPLTPPAEPNQQLDVEDKNRSGNQIEYDEDTGLDGVRNDGEPAPAPNTIRWGPKPAEQDPAGDDRLPDVETHLPDGRLIDRIRKYRGINGTEGNQRADGEDLDGDFSLDQENNYYEYRIDLSDPAFLDVGRDLGVSDSRNGWRLYRIPLDGYHMEVGTANLSQVEHMRMWFRGVDPGDTLDVQIASIEIVGNRWELAEGLKSAPDESFKMFVVNNKEDAGYTEPFEVERINNVKEREQSVALTFENLRPGSEHWAFSRQAKVRD